MYGTCRIPDALVSKVAASKTFSREFFPVAQSE